MKKLVLVIVALLVIIAASCESDNETVVTFDGKECTVSGPTEMPIGKNTFVFKDLSGQKQELWVSLLIDGHTYQDMLDLQSEPGVSFPQPRWVLVLPKVNEGWNESVGGEVYTFTSYVEGEHAIYIGLDSPSSLWFCSPLEIIEAAEG